MIKVLKIIIHQKYSFKTSLLFINAIQHAERWIALQGPHKRNGRTGNSGTGNGGAGKAVKNFLC